MEARWQEHCSDANRNKKRKFFAALNKYGIENWSHEILFESNVEQEILDKEVEFIDLFDSVKNGYNTSKERFRTGITHREDSIEKMRESQKAAHARRRQENNGIEKTKPHKKHVWGTSHPRKGKSNPNCGPTTGKMGWKKINGVRTWFLKQEATV
jgi:hypothetical protein